MNIDEAVAALSDLLDYAAYDDLVDLEGFPISRVQTFADVGMLTKDDGFVVTFEDGSQFALTVQPL